MITVTNRSIIRRYIFGPPFRLIGNYGTGRCTKTQECCSAAANFDGTSTFGDCGVGPDYCDPCGNKSIGSGFCADPTQCCDWFGDCHSDHIKCTHHDEYPYPNDDNGPFYCACDPNQDYVCVAQNFG